MRVALAVVALCAGCRKAGPKAAAAAGAASAPAIAVEVAVAKRDTVIDAIAATGQIEAVQAIELRPDVEGRIVEILFREGSEVARGTPLFRIDDAELQAQVVEGEEGDRQETHRHAAAPHPHPQRCADQHEDDAGEGERELLVQLHLERRLAAGQRLDNRIELGRAADEGTEPR
jgi:multidrug efflux pump subunit AcrA (membrane-fusion protein)